MNNNNIKWKIESPKVAFDAIFADAEVALTWFGAWSR